MNTFENGTLNLNLALSQKTADMVVALLFSRDRNLIDHIHWETVWKLGDKSRNRWIYWHAWKHGSLPASVIQDVIREGTASDIRTVAFYAEGSRLPEDKVAIIKKDFLDAVSKASDQRLAKVWNAVITYSNSAESVAEVLPGTFLPMALVIVNKRFPKHPDSWRDRSSSRARYTELITNRLRKD